MGLFKSLLYNTEFQSVEPDQRFNFMLPQPPGFTISYLTQEPFIQAAQRLKPKMSS